MRSSGRRNNELRTVSIDVGVNAYAEGSCFVKFGNTQVLCTATVDETLPPFLRGKGKGWVTAEYGMLPRSTHNRSKREAANGKQGGRTHEIQRLIGRSLRASLDLESIGERQIIIDCDVIQADGGTRTASITGGYVALYMAIKKLVHNGLIHKNPIINQMAAISCGIVDGTPMLDLDYIEDSGAEIDANFVMDSAGNLIEVQASGEERTFTVPQLDELIKLAQLGTEELFEIQKKALRIK
jgi:ribonuclease PH